MFLHSEKRSSFVGIHQRTSGEQRGRRESGGGRAARSMGESREGSLSDRQLKGSGRTLGKAKAQQYDDLRKTQSLSQVHITDLLLIRPNLGEIIL